MTKEELKKYKVERKPSALDPFFVIKDQTVTDKYGIYATGCFRYKGKYIIVNIEDGAWHLSVSSNHTLGYYELKDIRYKFMPNDMSVAQIFPRREEFVNLHENCFHFWQLKEESK